MRTESYALKNKEEIHAADKEQWFGNWIWRALLALVESPKFNPSPKWIARRLNVSIEKAVEALEGLERLELVQRVENSYKVTNSWLQVRVEKNQEQEMMNSFSKISVQVLNKMKCDDLYTNQFFVANRSLLEKYAPKFMELYKQLNDEAVALGMTEVFASQICFAKLSTEELETANGDGK